jgi:DNA modification methylase
MEGEGPQYQILQGDARERLRELPAASIHCIVTSPPYLGLRDYATEPMIWAGDPACAHAWGPPERGKRKDMLPAEESTSTGRTGSGEAQGIGPPDGGRFCAVCGAWRGHLGLEPTPTEYVAHIGAVTAECARVLRPDGVLWLNLGDSYNGSGGEHKDGGGQTGLTEDRGRVGIVAGRRIDHLKDKDLISIPWRTALGLQGFTVLASAELSTWASMLADAADRQDWQQVEEVRAALRWASILDRIVKPWFHRGDVVWQKPNPMPESVGDRPTRAHEFIFQLTRSKLYWYDAEAVRERTDRSTSGNLARKLQVPTRPNDHRGSSIPWENDGGGRNLRSVWTMTTQAMTWEMCTACKQVYSPQEHRALERRQIGDRKKKGKGLAVCRCGETEHWLSHFAVFPEALAARCIRSSCPHKACATCGAGWLRLAQSETSWVPNCDCHGDPKYVEIDCPDCKGTGKAHVYPDTGPNTGERQELPYQQNNPHRRRLERQQTEAECESCDGAGRRYAPDWTDTDLTAWPTRPGTVLDPFTGSGTTGIVAAKEGRSFIGIELQPDYAVMATERIGRAYRNRQGRLDIE